MNNNRVLTDKNVRSRTQPTIYASHSSTSSLTMSSSLLLLFLALLTLSSFSSDSSFISSSLSHSLSPLTFTHGDPIRIPLARKSIEPGQHFRSLHAIEAHAKKNFEGPIPRMSHLRQMMYSDPSYVVPMRNFFNRMYTGQVSVGTPAVSYSLVFDTGSADMWLFAARSTKPLLDYVTYYDYTKSSTSTVTTTPWSIQYGKGESAGNLVRDDVTLATKTVKNFKFAQASSYSSDFESPEMPLDGLLGLAFSSVNSADGPTLIDALLESGQIKERVFSFYLTPDGNPDGSEFILGAPDESLARGNLTYLDLATNGGMWFLSMQAVNLGSTSTSYCNDNCAVLMDTGTSFIGMPTAAYQDFARRINEARPDCGLDAGSGLIRCSSNTPEGLPEITFSIQGSAFSIQSSDYFQEGILGFMALSIRAGSNPFWIMGDTFLKTYYTVFDMDRRKIGIVGAKPGVPYTAPRSDDSRWGNNKWQLILLIIGAVLLGILLLFIFLRCCCKSSANRPPSPQPAAPYIRHSTAPSFSSAPSYSQHPANVGRYGGQPMSMPPPTSAMPYQNRPAATAPPLSDFARDFYNTRA